MARRAVALALLFLAIAGSASGVATAPSVARTSRSILSTAALPTTFDNISQSGDFGVPPGMEDLIAALPPSGDQDGMALPPFAYDYTSLPPFPEDYSEDSSSSILEYPVGWLLTSATAAYVTAGFLL